LDDAVIEHVRRLELHPDDPCQAVAIRSIECWSDQNSQLVDDLRGQEGAVRFGSAFDHEACNAKLSGEHIQRVYGKSAP
jgi:hypothetical protein